jgi:hypothetical protein
MNSLATFIQLGFRHIIDVEAMDHILFLLALAAIYRLRDARDALWVVTAFTVGHSITLALAVTGALTLPPALIEFLIPVTIVATGIENLVVTSSPACSDWFTAPGSRTISKRCSSTTSRCRCLGSTSASSSDRSPSSSQPRFCSRESIG